MLSTKNIVSSVKDIPAAWVFSNYCKVPIENFNGADFKIKSVFNDKDKTPSMSFYLKTSDYKFNDFSTGIKGDKVELVMNLFKLDGPKACFKIISDYNTWRLKNKEGLSIQEFKVHAKYQVSDYSIRSWTTADGSYWYPYNISSKILEHFNVHPLSSYTLSKEESDLNIIGEHLYGYFNEHSELCKIYQPKTENLKFIKVKSFVQGADQTTKQPFLLYLSSLKDIMSAFSFNLRLDFKAPDSENTLFTEAQVKKDLEQYQQVLVLFDNDSAGIKAANKYKDLYGITPVFLNYGEKDLSDHVKAFGVRKVKQWFIPLIDKKLNDE